MKHARHHHWLDEAALPPTVAVPPSSPVVVELDLSQVPRNVRRKALAKYGVRKQAKAHKRPSTRRAAVDRKEDEMGLEILGHEWSLGRGGRDIRKQRTGNNLRVVARLTCSGCDATDAIKHHAVLPAEMLDKRFKQKGWKLDPALCPECVQQPKEERQMASEAANVSAAAGLAQAKVFKLLTTQFDEEAGRYRGGYTDEKVAKETGCALVFVQQCRKECFGDLKEDPAVAEMRGDIAALEVLIAEGMAQLQQEVAQLKARLAKVLK